MQIDFGKLEADFRAWLENRMRDARETYGEACGYAEAVELEADPWLALQWFAEDMRQRSPI